MLMNESLERFSEGTGTASGMMNVGSPGMKTSNKPGIKIENNSKQDLEFGSASGTGKVDAYEPLHNSTNQSKEG